MDLLSKGYKFLSELDDPRAGDSSATDLESSLDGVAEKWLGWATGGPRVGNPAAPEELATISQTAGLHGDPELHEDPELEEPPPVTAGTAPSAEELLDLPASPEEDLHAAPDRDAAEPEALVVEEEAPPPPEAVADVAVLGPAEVEDARQMEAETAVEAEIEAAASPREEGDLLGGGRDEGLEEKLASQEVEVEAPEAPAAPHLPEHPAELTVSAETSTSPRAERAPAEDAEDAARVRADLADAQQLLKQRERQLSDLSNVLAEMEARSTAQREQSQSTKSKAVEAIRQAERVAQNWQKKAELAEQQKEEFKERAATEVRRLKQEARDMEQELHKAQDAWRDKIRKAEARAAELEKEGKDAANTSSAELAKMKARLRAQAAGSEETRGELEAYKARAEDEMGRLNERLRATAESELRVRHELQSSEHARQELQERVVELSGQLEHAQQAYSEAAREVGQMSLRLNELEFGQRADGHSEDLLRGELSATKERLQTLEERHKECVWMRDHALQQAEEVRGKLQAAEEQQEMLRAQMAEQGQSLHAAPEVNEALDLAQQEVAALQQQMQRLAEQHQTELQQQAAMSTEEIDYLKRKNEEKEKRLEILTCERNALRYEQEADGGSKTKVSPARPSARDEDKLVDLEDGLSLKELSREQGAVKARADPMRWADLREMKVYAFCAGAG
ncbi:unnamed protein product [Durusdinium trenchii]|uniref:Centrosomal protein of 162 kDa n=1 Tax=Durusdinium trenchii TaxID=1381693 RepID=A0ABP0P734_9DINO